jgi:ribosomal protein S18 acetylase RimI-like enzyme
MSEDRLAEAAAEVLMFPEGNVVRQAAFPHVFDANLVRHPRLLPVDLDATLSRLALPLREVGVRHLQITCDAGPLADELRAALRARRMGCEVLLAMALAGRPARRAPAEVKVMGARREAPRAWFAQAMERMSREEPWYSPSVAREIVGSVEAKERAGVLELFVAGLDGRPVGAAGVAIDAEAGVAAICSVGTIPEARHRGVAQALVVGLAERALDAGCDLVYLIARADDTPKDMYRKFGFEVVHRFEVWLRPPI